MKYTLSKLGSFSQACQFNNLHWCVTTNKESFNWYAAKGELFILDISKPIVLSEKRILILISDKFVIPQIRDSVDRVFEEFSFELQCLIKHVFPSLNLWCF